MPIQTKRIYDDPSPEDGHRLLVMRVWPRGVRKDRVDAWDRALAPSWELLADYRAEAIDWPAFARRFAEEMAQREESVAALAALRERVRTETVTLLCWEADGAMCHRTLLRALVEDTPLPA